MISELRPTAVNRVLQEVRQVQAEGKSVLSLMRGQPDTDTALHIVEAAERALHAGRTGYPDNRGEPALRQAVAEKLGRDGLQYDSGSEILVTDGATAGVYAALVALLDGNGDVLLPDPIYDAYASPIALARGRAVPVPSELLDGRFVLRRAALDAACTAESRVLLLNTPWNPVGTVLRSAELQEILDFAAARNMTVISDEIYEALVYDGRQHVSPAARARDRVVVVNSLSKTYSMTGWRVGFCAGAADVIGAMFLVLQQFSRGPATFVQDAAATALAGDQSAVREAVTEFQSRRDRVVEALRGIPGVTALVPEGGLFVMADVRGLAVPSDEIRRYLLRDAGVAVLHGSAYGPGGEGLLRVSFAGGGSTLDQCLARLRDGLLRFGK